MVSVTVSTYNADGSIHYVYHTDRNDLVTMDTMYYYTEIQVPKEDAP